MIFCARNLPRLWRTLFPWYETLTLMRNGIYPLILEILQWYRIQVMEWQDERWAGTDLHLHLQRRPCGHRSHRSHRPWIPWSPVVQQPPKTFFTSPFNTSNANLSTVSIPIMASTHPGPMLWNIILTFLKFLLLLLDRSQAPSVPPRTELWLCKARPRPQESLHPSVIEYLDTALFSRRHCIPILLDGQ